MRGNDLYSYISTMFGTEVQRSSTLDVTGMPFFILDCYELLECTILGNPCLFMVAKQDFSLVELKKHREKLLCHWQGICALVPLRFSAYRRKSLIQQRVPFAVVGSQFFLPELGVSLTESFQQLRPVMGTSFAVVTQVVLIHVINEKQGCEWTPSELAVQLPFSRMSMTRAFNEIESAGIGRVERRGKQRVWIFEGTKQQLWEQVHPLMSSPVKKVIYLPIDGSELPISGLTALSYHTMVAKPKLPTRAVGPGQLPSLAVVENVEQAACVCEVWTYDPMLFARNGVVDPYSLYLSLRVERDERIEMACEELMESVKW